MTASSIEIQNLRKRYTLSVRTARLLITEFGASTSATDWTDVLRVLRIPGVGPVSMREIYSCLDKAGLKRELWPPKLTQDERLANARKAIEKTVQRMGGKIQWIASVEAISNKRSKRRRKTVAKWRAKKAAETSRPAASEPTLQKPPMDANKVRLLVDDFLSREAG